MSEVEEGTCIYGDEEAPCLLLDGNAIRVSDALDMARVMLDRARGGVEA